MKLSAGGHATYTRRTTPPWLAVHETTSGALHLWTVSLESDGTGCGQESRRLSCKPINPNWLIINSDSNLCQSI